MKFLILISFLITISSSIAKDSEAVDSKSLKEMKSSWGLSSGDEFNCPDNLDFNPKDDRIEYIEYYGLKHRDYKLVRSRSYFDIGHSRLANRLYETSLSGNVLKQKVDRKLSLGRKKFEKESTYTFEKEKLIFDKTDKHLNVEFSCQYRKCHDVICSPKNYRADYKYL